MAVLGGILLSLLFIVAIVHAAEIGKIDANDFDEYEHQAEQQFLTYGVNSEISKKMADLFFDFARRTEEHCKTRGQTVLDEVNNSFGILSERKPMFMKCLKSFTTTVDVCILDEDKYIVDFVHNFVDTEMKTRDFEGIFECMKNNLKNCKDDRVIPMLRSIHKAADGITHCSKVAIVRAGEIGEIDANDFDRYENQTEQQFLAYGFNSEISKKMTDMLFDFAIEATEYCDTQSQTVIDKLDKSPEIFNAYMLELENHPRCFEDKKEQEAQKQCMNMGMLRRTIAATHLKDIATFNAADCRDFEGIYQCMKNNLKNCKDDRVIPMLRSIHKAADGITHCSKGGSVVAAQKSSASAVAVYLQFLLLPALITSF
ncbi:hypothetical protein B566_EDAN009868 [Ephemera danica]|nr:hypothetical protein B566_EDAN009868 [Ephemera danica]